MGEEHKCLRRSDMLTDKRWRGAEMSRGRRPGLGGACLWGILTSTSVPFLHEMQ